MKIKIRKTSDSAVVGVVTAILFMGLIVMILSVVQLVYVPMIMEQREAEHMDRVAEQFGFLTSVIDDQAADKQKDIPIAAFVTLGSEELPFLVSSKAYGTLEILENSSSITINNESVTKSYILGSVTYSSNNVYYLDQTYTYEAGAMIVSQSQGNKMMVRPGFFVDYNKLNDIVNITFNVVNISSIGLKTTAAGYGSCGIQTEFDGISTDVLFTDVFNMTISSVFSDSWLVFMDRSLMGAGLNSVANPNQYAVTDMGQILRIYFHSDLTVNVFFKVIEIKAQIGPGWIE